MAAPSYVAFSRDKVLASQSLGRVTRNLHELSPLQRAVARDALINYAQQQRSNPEVLSLTPIPKQERTTVRRRLSILIRLAHQDSSVEACIDSVLACTDPELDSVALFFGTDLNARLSKLVRQHAHRRNVYLLSSSAHDGTLDTDLEALSFFETGDVLVVKSSTRIFPGVLDELLSVAHRSADIGIVSALANATPGFSYPATSAADGKLDDLTWEQVSAAALKSNRGRAVDASVGNAACLLIRRSALDCVGVGAGRSAEELSLSEVCARAVDQGFRNVVAGGAFVENLEPVFHGGLGLRSGSDESVASDELVGSDSLEAILAHDDLLIRAARWGIDMFRLNRALRRGRRYTLCNHQRPWGRNKQSGGRSGGRIGIRHRRSSRAESTRRWGNVVDLQIAIGLFDLPCRRGQAAIWRARSAHDFLHSHSSVALFPDGLYQVSTGMGPIASDDLLCP